MENSKILFGCAMFHDILKSPAILCKALQNTELCIVRAIEGFIHTSKNVDKLKTHAFEKLPSVEKALLRLHEGDGKTVYQGVESTNHTEGIRFLKTNFGQFVDFVLKMFEK